MGDVLGDEATARWVERLVFKLHVAGLRADSAKDVITQNVPVYKSRHAY